MREPLRLIQTNLRETDSTLNAVQLSEQLESFPANTLLFSVGGIVAHYPTQVEFHYPSRYLPEGEDLVGSVLDQCHQRGIRVIGRFDFSRARKAVYDAHPEWFFRNAEGDPVVDDNGLYSSCINGGYYHAKALEVLEEALTRYSLDGLFFNWFGNLRWDYKGNEIGLCHCDECRRRFREEFGKDLPEEPDADYERFMFESSRSVAATFRGLIKRLRPEALFMTYIQEYTDGIVDEADFYKWRPLPLWVYSASENVNRARNSQPGKMSFDLVMPYQEMRYRFASVPGPALRALLYENLAQGAFPAFVLLGTFDQPDKTAQEAVRPVFEWHRRHEEILLGQHNIGRVILYARQDPGWSSSSSDYRGLYRLLSELHIPFRATNRVNDLDPGEIDLVVVPRGPLPQDLNEYLRRGGRVLLTGAHHPGAGFPDAVRLWNDTRSSYMRIEDHALLPSLDKTNVLFWEGEYLEFAPEADSPLTLIPPSQFGPPDMVSTLAERTVKPGLILKTVGQGRLAYLPWDLGRLYYLYSNDKHRRLFSDLVDHLLPRGRQLITNAHPLVETTLTINRRGQTLLHLVNLTGHAGTALYEAVPVTDIQLRIKGDYGAARALYLGTEIPLRQEGSYTRLTLGKLREYEAIVLE